MTSSPSPRQSNPARALELVDELARRIASGQWAPGDKVTGEFELMAEFGVSRTVVRDALSRLKALGLVYARQGLGTFVARPSEARPFSVDPQRIASLDDLIAVLELRMGIEPEAAAMAAQRRSAAELLALRQALDAVAEAWHSHSDPVAADFRFHCEIARCAHNPHYLAMMGALSPASLPRCWQSHQEPPEQGLRRYVDSVVHEHEEVYQAIAQQDPDAARAAMRLHVINSRERHREAERGQPVRAG
ncbi:FadR/GntR family transcriptional regulator [Curvibacter sp. HBC28]|uniref:FadR/GntR family transcriptional regulator n=1 Tax=Curvibacter microcysteis TaxID=3026419 RepID=A0ABT5MFT8_9BURK|nr:FadR/GntR family transcriptional regulator [Curvibacter sp. HBC28]MDD0814787.1 FadR/GntR family transcriptional regulator [Curvibacter sp. HBC28]